jgi:hypothetical protein
MYFVLWWEYFVWCQSFIYSTNIPPIMIISRIYIYIKILSRCSLFPSWSGYGLISTPIQHTFSHTGDQMTRWSNNRPQTHTPLQAKKKGRQEFGIAYGVDSRCKENILSFPTISKRICTLSMKTKRTNATFINIRAPWTGGKRKCLCSVRKNMWYGTKQFCQNRAGGHEKDN